MLEDMYIWKQAKTKPTPPTTNQQEPNHYVKNKLRLELSEQIKNIWGTGEMSTPTIILDIVSLPSGP